LGAKTVEFRVHSTQKEFRRRGKNPGALKLQNLFALTTDLQSHMLDFRSDKFECRHVPLRGMDAERIEQKANESQPLGLAVVQAGRR
jgi:hypothetical protein